MCHGGQCGRVEMSDGAGILECAAAFDALLTANTRRLHAAEGGAEVEVVSSKKALAALRNQATLESARAAGLLGAGKNARVAGRVSAELIAAAKQSAGLSSDTDVIEIALAKLALEDDFGAKLVRNKGSVPRELDIGL
jgi:hypothetical protein